MHAWKCSRNKSRPVETVQISFIEFRDLKHQFQAWKVEKKKEERKMVIARNIDELVFSHWLSMLNSFKIRFDRSTTFVWKPFGMLSPLPSPSMKWFKWQLIVYPFKLPQTARVTFCQNNHLANYQFTRKPRRRWLRKLLLTKEKFDSTRCYRFAVIHCDNLNVRCFQQLANTGITYWIKLRLMIE